MNMQVIKLISAIALLIVLETLTFAAYAPTSPMFYGNCGGKSVIASLSELSDSTYALSLSVMNVGGKDSARRSTVVLNYSWTPNEESFTCEVGGEYSVPLTANVFNYDVGSDVLEVRTDNPDEQIMKIHILGCRFLGLTETQNEVVFCLYRMD